jgi:hypothetical protein
MMAGDVTAGQTADGRATATGGCHERREVFPARLAKGGRGGVGGGGRGLAVGLSGRAHDSAALPR